MYVPITTFNIGYPLERTLENDCLNIISLSEKIARGYLTFFALFSGKSFSPPPENEQTRQKTLPGRF